MIGMQTFDERLHNNQEATVAIESILENSPGIQI